MLVPRTCGAETLSLNESPSEKEGKCWVWVEEWLGERWSLNESPSEKEGKSVAGYRCRRCVACLNESPSEKEGK